MEKRAANSETMQIQQTDAKVLNKCNDGNVLQMEIR